MIVGDAEQSGEARQGGEPSDGGGAEAEVQKPAFVPWAYVSTGSDVLIVGDSHLLLCGAPRTFPQFDVYARPGRNSTEALGILGVALRPRHRVVVFDLAANDVEDPGTYEANLELLWERIGSRELVLVDTWRADRRDSHRGVNAILRRFVERHPQRTALVRWSSQVESHPSPFGPDPDYIHFTPDVYRSRTELLHEAIAAAHERATSKREGSAGEAGEKKGWMRRLFSRSDP